MSNGEASLKISKTVNPCDRCEYYDTCKKSCPALEDYLKEVEQGRRGDTVYQSGDLIDRKYGKKDRDPPDEGEKREAWERRCQVVKETIEYFSGFDQNSAKYLMIWQFNVQEKLSQREIAELTGTSQQTVSWILKKIKDRKSFTNSHFFEMA